MISSRRGVSDQDMQRKENMNVDKERTKMNERGEEEQRENKRLGLVPVRTGSYGDLRLLNIAFRHVIRSVNGRYSCSGYLFDGQSLYCLSYAYPNHFSGVKLN
jgi:hypothetical protein